MWIVLAEVRDGIDREVLVVGDNECLDLIDAQPSLSAGSKVSEEVGVDILCMDDEISDNVE